MSESLYLGWWEEPEFHTCAAALRNVSHGGALVDVAVRSPDGASLWLCLAGASGRVGRGSRS